MAQNILTSDPDGNTTSPGTNNNYTPAVPTANGTNPSGPQAGPYPNEANPVTPPSMTMPQGIDPRLAQLYQQHGLNPAGEGTGFADWNYWQNLANRTGDWDYVLGRLGSDLAGTGTDRATGTPGSGAWSTSGANSGSGSGPGSFGNGIDMNLFYQGWSPRFTGAQDNLYNTLMNRANQSLNINSQDPIIRNQVDAYSANQTRNQRNYLSDLAERSGPNANLNEERRMTSEAAGQNTSQFQAALMQNELTARRTEIQNALTQMGGMLSEQQRAELQQQLGLIDASLRQGQLGLTAEQYAAYWDAIRSGLITG